ncbi:MAG: hypothetical protein ACJAZM_000698 [Cyclobacteriaceae bacterium]|jgi:hypothetical protein
MNFAIWFEQKLEVGIEKNDIGLIGFLAGNFLKWQSDLTVE